MAALAKRRHAASASRILAGGMSVAATLGLTAYLGLEADAAETVELDTVATTPAEPQQRVVIVRRIIREVYAEPTGPAATTPGAEPHGAAVPASSSTPPAPATSAPAPAPAPASIPTLPSAALAPPPAPAPAPATSSNGS